MNAVEKPIYIVAIRDEYICFDTELRNAMTAFGTEEHARTFAHQHAKETNTPPALYRIVRYDFSGEVKEA